MSELDGRLAVLNPHLHDGVPLAEAARRAGVPRRAATRWLAAYQANGLDGLRRLDRADRGGRRLPQEMIELIEGMASAGSPRTGVGRRCPTRWCDESSPAWTAD